MPVSPGQTVTLRCDYCRGEFGRTVTEAVDPLACPDCESPMVRVVRVGAPVEPADPPMAP